MHQHGKSLRGAASLAAVLFLAACASDAPTSPAPALTARADRGESHRASGPSINLNVELRGARDAEGSIRFRQPNDGATTIFLDTRIEGLQRNHDYFLQRAAQDLGAGCVDDGWLTLGLGPVATAIHTDNEGEGHAQLFRTLPASLIGASFDIHFQIIDAVTGAVVLHSGCYQYTVSAT
jgi:hypothetical protein